MRVLPLGDLHQLVDDVSGRGPIRVAHAHVDDVLATPARSHFQFAGDVEDVRRQPLDPRKLDHV